MPGGLLCALGGQRRHSRLQLPREMEEGTRSEGGSGTPRLLQSRLGKGPEAGSWTVFSGPWLGTRTEGVPGAWTQLAWALGSERAGSCMAAVGTGQGSARG